MDMSSIGVICGAAAAVGLLWWGAHASPLESEIDPQADRAFRLRTQRRPEFQ